MFGTRQNARMRISLDNFGETNVRVIHTLGHSVGHCCFLIEDNVKIIYLGDIDLTSFGPWYGCLDCDVDDFVNSINNIAEVVDAEKVEIAVSVIGGQSWEWKILWQVDSISVTDIFLYVQSQN